MYFLMFWTGCSAALLNPIWRVANYMIAYQVHPPMRWWGEPLVRMGMRFSWLAMVFILLGLLFTRRRAPAIRPAISLWELGICGLVYADRHRFHRQRGVRRPAGDEVDLLWIAGFACHLHGGRARNGTYPL